MIQYPSIQGDMDVTESGYEQDDLEELAFLHTNSLQLTIMQIETASRTQPGRHGY